jgi:hypothetical protein
MVQIDEMIGWSPAHRWDGDGQENRPKFGNKADCDRVSGIIGLRVKIVWYSAGASADMGETVR